MPGEAAARPSPAQLRWKEYTWVITHQSAPLQPWCLP